MAAAGIKASDFGPANWKAAQGPDGKQYAVPLDIHSIILYYNKDMLKKAGLLGEDGKPKGLDGADNFDAALAKLTANGVYRPFGADRRRAGWRIFYTLLNQQDGQFLKDGKFLEATISTRRRPRSPRCKVGQERLGAGQHRISGLDRPVHLGQGGDAINGVWEVPTMVDLAKKGQAVRLGRDPDPGLLRPSRHLGRLAFLRHSRPQGQSGSPEKRKLVLDTIHWFNDIRSNGRAAAMSPPICRCRTARRSRT